VSFFEWNELTVDTASALGVAMPHKLGEWGLSSGGLRSFPDVELTAYACGSFGTQASFRT